MAGPSTTEASRAAVRKWLTESVGVGGRFTMQDLRHAIPGVEQIGRRMRDLRGADPPWKIASSQTDPSLPTGYYRLDEVGGDRMQRQRSARVRREVLEAASNRCQVCGIGVGEEYDEWPGEVARLQLGHWVPKDQGGSTTNRSNLRAECHRCNGGIRHHTGAVVTSASVRARVGSLKRADRQRLLEWLKQGQREVSDAERIFYEARQLPPSELSGVVKHLRQLVERKS